MPGVKAALPGVRPIVFGHLGDGNLHYNLLPPLALDKGRWIAEMPALTRLVHDETRRQRGSISAEHGIGQLRVSEMERCKSRSNSTSWRRSRPCSTRADD